MFKMGGMGYIKGNAISFAPVSHNVLASINEIETENVSFAIKRD